MELSENIKNEGETAAKPRKRRSWARRLRGLLLGVVIFLLAAAIGLYSWFRLDRRSPFSLLPEDFIAYIQLPSVLETYDDLRDLKSIDAVFTVMRMQGARKALNDFRDSPLANSPLLKQALRSRADLMLERDGNVLIVLDLGYASMLSRLTPFLGPFLSVENLSFIKGKRSYYRYETGSFKVYAAPVANLLVLATSEEGIRRAFSQEREKTNFGTQKNARVLSRLSQSGEGLRFIADSARILFIPLSFIKQGDRILSHLSFSEEGIVQAKLDNHAARIDLDLAATSDLSQLRDLFRGGSQAPRFREIAPQGTAFLVSLNSRDPRLLFELSTALEPGLADTFEKAEQAAKLALGKGLDELVFSWLGGELGFFQQEERQSPVFFARIKDESKRLKIFKGVFSGVLIEDKEVSARGQSLRRIGFPWYIDAVLKVAKVNIEMPYMGVRDGFLYLSQDSEALAMAFESLSKGQTLRQAEGFSTFERESLPEGFFYAYYSGGFRPFFLDGTDPVSAVLSPYDQGLLSLWPGEGGLRARLQTRSQGIKPRRLAAFPIDLDVSLSGLLATQFQGGERRIIAYTEDKAFLIDPYLPEQPQSWPIPKGAELVPGLGDTPIWLILPNGEVYRWPNILSGPSESAVASDLESSMPPLALPQGLLLASLKEKRLMLLGHDGRVQAWGPQLEDPVFAQPIFQGDVIAFATKGFSGLVYACDAQGQTLSGWPRLAGGLSQTGPRAAMFSQDLFLAQLSQNGNLRLFKALPDQDDRDYNLGSSFHLAPEPARLGQTTVLACLDDDGRLCIYDEGGACLASRDVAEAKGKRSRLYVADILGDANSEILILCPNGSVLGFDSNLGALPGFPLSGGLGLLALDLGQKKKLLCGTRSGLIDLVDFGG